MSSETIGQRVRRLREERKLSAAALAKTVGIRENALYKIESGDTKTPNLTTGLRLAAALGVDPWFLAFGRSRPSAATEPGEQFEPDEPRVTPESFQELLGEVQGLQAAQTERAKQIEFLVEGQRLIQVDQIKRDQQISALEESIVRLTDLVQKLGLPPGPDQSSE